MTTRIGINGFGRMGRLVMRAAWDAPELELVHINEIGGGPEVSAHLLAFDSVHGRWRHNPYADGDAIGIGDRRVTYSQCNQPADIPWSAHDVDIVLECTGAFRTRDAIAPHLAGSPRKVVVAAPVHEGALNIVMGINHERYKPEQHDIVTAASCTTNCLAPVVRVVHDKVGIRHGTITTIHDVTNTQVIVDRPHKDLRRARSALMSLVPTTTGSATAIGLIYPELRGKLDGLAVRVPLLNASLTDCVFEVERTTTIEEINGHFETAANGELKGILGYEQRPLVSVDYVDDTRSAIVDAPSTMVTNGTQLKVLAWYDNEIGYVHRMTELVQLISKTLP